jgi:hypothetical protein
VSRESIDPTADGRWRLSDSDGKTVGEYDRWRDAEKERVWGERKDRESREREDRR